MGGVEGIDVLPTLLIVAAVLQRIDQSRNHVVLDLLAVMGDIARSQAFLITGAVEIDPAHFQRILAQMTRDIVEDVFNRNRTLWTAETTEGCIGLRIGLAAHGMNVDVRQIIGIVEMAYRTG